MAVDKNIFLHESDKAALDALEAIPGFTQVTKAFIKAWNEKMMYIQNMSTNIRIDERQLKKYHDMLIPICEKLDIEVPDLFLTLNVVPNAWTSGDEKPYIVMTSGLLETMPEELIPTILAHECGHIACHHVLYRTMGQMILNGSLMMMLGTGLGAFISIPLRSAFAYWMRCSEFSADRAAILCDGSADHLVEMCMRFAGFGNNVAGEMNREAFIDQARDYKKLIENDQGNQAMEFMLFRNNSHPINAVRALEAMDFASSQQFYKAKRYMDACRRKETPFEFPLSFSDHSLIGKDLAEVRKELEEKGFEVSVQRLTEKNILLKEGSVTKILLNGSDAYKEGDWFEKGAKALVEYYRPLSEKEVTRMHPGQVRMPNASSYYIGKDIREADMELYEAGIVNTSLVPLRDLESNKDPRMNKVVSISINGKESFEKDEWVSAMDDVAITYHTDR